MNRKVIPVHRAHKLEEYFKLDKWSSFMQQKKYLWVEFELLRFWLDREAAPDILYMAPDGSPIEEKDSLRDLG